MKIKKVLTCKGLSGYYNKDLAAIKKGAVPDGFVFRDPPITPGFRAITQPGEALSVILLLSDGQVAFGDCIDVIFTGMAGRDPIFQAAEHEKIVEREIAAFLQGKSILRFKELAESIDSIQIAGRRLHTAVRYGVTQALLDGAAKANQVTMAEVIGSEYGCSIATHPIPLLACSPNDQKVNIDKMVLKKAPYLPHGSSSHMERDVGRKGEKLLAYIHGLIDRIQALKEADYHPTIHLDLYGTLGEAFAMNVEKVAEFVGRMEEACSPFPLMVETPIIAESREKQITLYQALLAAMKKRSIGVKVVVDEWCNTLEDFQLFSEERAGDILQVKTPDLGGIHHSIEAILICKKKGMGVYVGGTVNGTDQSAKISAHIALATQADFLIAKPGQGVDEALMIEYNEMQRALTLIKNRKI